MMLKFIDAELNENERRDFPPGPGKKCDRYRTGQCVAVEDPVSSATCVLSHAAEQDACLLHENSSDEIVSITHGRRG